MKAARSFQSPLAEHFQKFLTHHRALGKRYDNEESALFLLDRFLTARNVREPEQLTPELLEKFLNSRQRRKRSRNHLLNVLQRLFRWLVGQGLLTASPLRSQPRRSLNKLRPYLFQERDVQRILSRAAALRDWPRGCQRGVTYRMIFALMYGLGLRVGEVSRLCRRDVDLERCCLHIRETKFLKSRLVPFGPRMKHALQAYVKQRQPAEDPRAPLFSLAKDGRRPISRQTISRTLRELATELNLTAPSGTAPPRAHGLRHSFAVSTLLAWYRSGVDPASMLMHLSVFLGHANPASTAVYLTVTDELLALAKQRFERYAEGVLKGVPS